LPKDAVFDLFCCSGPLIGHAADVKPLAKVNPYASRRGNALISNISGWTNSVGEDQLAASFSAKASAKALCVSAVMWRCPC
jgi:hypothetical protein